MADSVLPQDRPHVLFVMWRSLGHVNASFGVAKKIVRAGYSVSYTGPSDLSAVVARQGFQLHRTTAFDGLPIPLGIARRPGDLAPLVRRPKDLARRLLQERRKMRLLLDTIDERAAAFDALLSARAPAFLVFDPFLLYFYPVAHRRRIPAAALSTKSLATRDALVPPYTSMTVPRPTLAGRIRIRAEWAVQAARYRAWTAYERALFGTSPYDVARRFARGSEFPLSREWATRSILTDLRFQSVPEWVLHAPEFDFPRSPGKLENARFVGPCVDLERAEAPFDWSAVPPGRLILCVLTSVFHAGSAAAARRARFVRELLRCMASLPEFTLLVSVGRGFEGDPRTELPANTRVFETIPTLQVMRRAELLITQGGGNICKEAVMLGARLLTFPSATDQPGFSARLAYHELGLRHPMADATAPLIRSLILRALADGDAPSRIHAMGDVFRAHDRTGDLFQGALAELSRRASPSERRALDPSARGANVEFGRSASSSPHDVARRDALPPGAADPRVLAGPGS